MSNNTTPYLLAGMIHETECVLAILRTVNDVSDPKRKSYLIDAAEFIASQLLKKLDHNDNIEEGE